MVPATEVAQMIELAQTINEQQRILATALARLVGVEESVNPIIKPFGNLGQVH
jgi:hypothetical protein